MHYLVVTLQIVSSWQRKYNDSSRPVASGGAGWQNSNPVSTSRADYAHHSTKCPSEFSDLATVLGSI